VAKDQEVELLTAIVLKVAKGFAMPEVIGKNFDEVQKALSDLGYTKIVPDFVSSEKEDGTILEQRPEKGAQIDENTEIHLTVSTGPAVVAVKKTVAIDVSALELTESFDLELREKDDVSAPVTYAAGTNAVTITVEGYGTVEYEIWIDDICVKEFTIDFSDGQSTVQIKVG
jgi:beta-lactam-binding protein with PASTA domain